MTSPFRISGRSQRRLSVVLSLALCVWLLSFATHLHAGTSDLHGGSVAHFCGTCASIPTGAAAPAVVSFVPTPGCELEPDVADEIRILPSPALASYQSRAPPRF